MKDEPCCGCTDESRRGFLTKLCLGLGGAIGAIITLPAISYIFAPLTRKRTEIWRDVGAIGDFISGTTKLVSFENASSLPWAGITAKSASWVRRDDTGALSAFSVNCTHLGCPVRWEQGSSLFMCPCHGGVYYSDGKVAAGPPPKPLPSYQVRENNGRVEVLTAPVPITTTTSVEL